VDTITDIKQPRLQKDGGADVTSYDVSVKSSDTGWGSARFATIALSMCEFRAKARSQVAGTSEAQHGNC